MLKYSDSPESRSEWKRLEETTSPEFVSSMRDLYSLYDAELVDWFAGLYDPSIGGWYYSNSARDNEKVTYKDREYLLLPDAESTRQALGCLYNSGITLGKPYGEFLPEIMKREIGNFMYNLQDPDGFFYHPQWGKDIPLSRRGRDLSWGRITLENLGMKTKYPTVVDTPPESREANKETLIPEHLRSKDAFIDYLDSLDIEHHSYHAGNQLDAQFAQIKSQGLADTLIDYLNEKRNAENGFWHAETNYYGNNGFMKISGTYNGAGRLIPYAKEAAMSAFRALSSDEPVKGIVDIYNIWVSISNIKNNLRRFGGEDGGRLADELLSELRIGAVDALRHTKEKLAVFKEPDHAISYCIGHASFTSQGMPVCIPDLPEGDVNATSIAVSTGHNLIYSALELNEYRIPLFGKSDSDRFLAIIEENRKK